MEDAPIHNVFLGTYYNTVKLDNIGFIILSI